MRMSQLFSQTLRQPPSEAEVASHRLLLRAGFIRQLGAGIFSYLPLARRSLNKIENIMRAEINAIGGQEITMPVVHPADVWKATGRWAGVGAEMGRFVDRVGRDMVLAMTHEEVVADLVRQEIRSYRQLPQLIYHIQTKWRDDPRPRAGLIRVREFTMLDSYSLDADREGLDRQYEAHYSAYFNIFGRCNLPVIAVKSDVGMMGGSMAHEYMYLTPVGEDTIIVCRGCGYTANRQVARMRKPAAEPEAARPIEQVATPNMTSIEDLAAFLGVPKARTAKAVFMVAGAPGDAEPPRFVFAVVRGDMDVNETKLQNALGAVELRPAREDEIRAVGAVPGYASPLGLSNPLIVADEAVTESPNLVAGANVEGYHLLNVNYGRDFTASLVGDIAVAGAGDACPECGEALEASRGVEVGNIFKLGTRYTDALGCAYLDQAGRPQPIVMGSYGIGSGRLLACIAEEHHDDAGLIWPISVAPFHVHLLAFPGKDNQVSGVAEQLYAELTATGVEVLYDERAESPGVKFADADLIGLPLRLTVGERGLKRGVVELKRRSASEVQTAPLDGAVAAVQAELRAMAEETVRTTKATK